MPMDVAVGELVSKLLGGLGATVLAVGAYSWRKQDARIEELEKTAVRVPEMSQLREDVRRMDAKIDRLVDHLLDRAG